MRLLYFAVFLILKSFGLNGQAYVNRAIDFPTGSFLSLGLEKVNNKFTISLAGSEENSVLFTDLENDFFLFIPDFIYCLDPDIEANNNLVLLGNDLFNNRRLKLLNISDETHIIDTVSLTMEDIAYYIPFNLVKIDESYYFGLFRQDTSMVLSKNKISLIKYDNNYFTFIDNNLIKESYFSIYGSDISVTKNKSILLACQINFNDGNGSNGYVYKFDTLGDAKFKSDTLVRTNIIYPKIYLTELSDQSVLVCYHQDMHGVAGWHDYYPYMPTYNWLDSVGKISRQIIPRIRRPAEVVSSGILAGRGGLFFQLWICHVIR